MSELLTMQDLANGHLDVKALGEAANGDENTIVTTRTGNTYPSAERAINIMFKNGGLPATPFKTKALMTASALADGKYAQVTDDTVNNGLYVKTAGAWVKSGYDPLTQAKADASDKISAAKNELRETLAPKERLTYYKEFEQGWVTTLGEDTTNTTRARSPVYEFEAGTVITFKRNNPNHFVGFGSSSSPKVAHYDGLWENKDIFTHTVTAENPYIRFFVRGSSNGTANITGAEAGAVVDITTSESVLYESDLPEIDPTALDAKADAVRKKFYRDFEQGYVNTLGVEIASNTRLRSPVYKMKAGDVIYVNRIIGNEYQLGYNTSSTEAVGHWGDLWFAEDAVIRTVTKSEPYVRFFIRRKTNTEIEASVAASVSEIHTISNVVYEDALIGSSGDLSSIGVEPFNSLYRTPSQAIGGVVTIIDDDGRDAVYSGLYSFLKGNGVPFATAVVTGHIDAKSNIMKLSELKEIAKDTDFVEVMSHSWSHGNQATATLTDIQKEAQLVDAKQWFVANGFHNVTGFVFPYGFDDAKARARVMRHYNSAYDYGDANRVETFSTIRNELISRTSWNVTANNLAFHKQRLDECVANNAWMVICTHVDSGDYWGAESYAELQEFIDYAKSKGVKFMLPKHGFQTFGNIAENDSGFKIQANGKIVGAT